MEDTLLAADIYMYTEFNVKMNLKAYKTTVKADKII